MATILPFKAVRPSVNLAKKVSSRSFESYTSEGMSAVLSRNPESFLQILNPGYAIGKKLTGKSRYRMVRERYAEFLNKEIIIREKKPCVYLYEIKKGSAYYLGFFGITSTEEYRQGIIKRHEQTLESREQLFARYLAKVRFNAEPVLMMYPDEEEISGIMEQERQRVPLYDFATADGYTHRLWGISQPGTLSRIQELFRKQVAIYIADGHHRSASSNRMALQAMAANPYHSGLEAYNYFLSYLLPESAIRVYQYTRMIRDLNGHDESALLRLLEQYYEIRDKGSKPWEPKNKHQFCMYLGKHFYEMRLKEENWTFNNALSRLDPHILYTTVLKPLLGIADLRNDQRIAYGSGNDSVEQMKRYIDEGNFAVGFGMVAVSIGEIKAIADAGLVMPPKSTYIEPKLRSGLIIYEF